MYWGDAFYNRIDVANIYGSGRKIILTVNKANFYSFVHHAGFIYFTVWNPPYVFLLIPRPTRWERGVKRWRCLSFGLSVCLSLIAHVRLVQKPPNQRYRASGDYTQPELATSVVQFTEW